MKIVLIEWMDAHGGTCLGWRPIREIRDREPAAVVSVGYLLKETPEYVVVCPHMTKDENDKFDFGDGELAIPRAWIRKLKVLQR